MPKVSSSEMVKPLSDILAELETKGYVFTYYQLEVVESRLEYHAQVKTKVSMGLQTLGR